MKKTLLAFLILCSTPGIALAQTLDSDLDLTVFPPTAYLVVKPGTEITHRVLLRHNGRVAVKIIPKLIDFTTDGLTGTPVLAMQKPSQIKYVSLQNPDKQLGEPFQLKPDSQVELVIKIDPPLHSKRGEWPLSLVLTAVPETSVVFDGGSAQASGAVASNMILSVQNDFDNQGELQIEKIKLPKIVDSFASIKFETIVKNIGRNAAAVTGQIRLNHGWSGKELKHWYVYPDVVLANSTRQLRTTPQDPDELSPEDEVVFEELSYKPPFLIGPHEVTAEISSANLPNGTFHQRTQTIIALPLSIIALLGLGVGLYIFITKFDQKKRS